MTATTLVSIALSSDKYAQSSWCRRAGSTFMYTGSFRSATKATSSSNRSSNNDNSRNANDDMNSNYDNNDNSNENNNDNNNVYNNSSNN